MRQNRLQTKYKHTRYIDETKPFTNKIQTYKIDRGNKTVYKQNTNIQDRSMKQNRLQTK